MRLWQGADVSVMGSTCAAALLGRGRFRAGSRHRGSARRGVKQGPFPWGNGRSAKGEQGLLARLWQDKDVSAQGGRHRGSARRGGKQGPFPWGNGRGSSVPRFCVAGCGQGSGFAGHPYIWLFGAYRGRKTLKEQEGENTYGNEKDWVVHPGRTKRVYEHV